MLLTGEEPEPRMELALGFSAGVMLVASFTSLLLPALRVAGFARVALGTALGVLCIYAVERYAPHEHLLRGYEGPPQLRGLLRKTWLLALAIIIHNIPEGLSVGVATTYSVVDGVATALAIGLQDIPEGLAVALPVSKVQGRWVGALVGALSGLVETAMSVLAAAILAPLPGLLPLAMGFAGGSMLYVVLKEVVPEIYREGSSEVKASLGLLAGVYVMLFLDTALQ